MAQKTVYRLVSQNILIAVGVALFPAVMVGSGWYSEDPQSLRITWWSMPSIGLVVGVLVLRALRRGVVVTDTALVDRRLFQTQVFPWYSFRFFWIPAGRRARLLIRTYDGRKFALRVYNHRDRPFPRCVDPVIPSAGPERTDREPGPDPAPTARVGVEPWVRVAAWVSLALLPIGFLFIDDARYDRVVYAARAARDAPGAADVLRAHVEEHDGEDETTYTTAVDIAFFLGERRIETSIQRPGRYRFAQEARIPIVYDSMHPRDADFGDRYNRRANDASVRRRLWVGPKLAAMGLGGCIAFGLLLLKNLTNIGGKRIRRR
jgi:hypothetical protein